MLLLGGVYLRNCHKPFKSCVGYAEDGTRAARLLCDHSAVLQYLQFIVLILLAVGSD